MTDVEPGPTAITTCMTRRVVYQLSMVKVQSPRCKVRVQRSDRTQLRAIVLFIHAQPGSGIYGFNKKSSD